MEAEQEQIVETDSDETVCLVNDNKSVTALFKIFMAVTVLMIFFWVKSLCGLIGRS
jgi:ribose 5-phosphate isomerase